MLLSNYNACQIGRFGVFFAVILLAGCGGGGGGDSAASGTDSQQAGPSQPVITGDVFPVNEDNYVAIASSLYMGVHAVAGANMLHHAISLLDIQIRQSPLTTASCSRSGDIITEVVRTPWDSADINVGNSVMYTYRACNRGSDSESGTISLVVNQREGVLSSDNYILRTDLRTDTTQSGNSDPALDGRYSAHLPFTSSARGSLKIIGINISALYAGRVVDQQNNEFADVILGEMPLLLSDPVYYESPDSRFDQFAYEVITDTALTVQRRKYQWDMDVVNRVNPAGSHRIMTDRQLILEKRTVQNDEGEDQEVDVALDGGFTITFRTGEVIHVSVASPDAGAVPGVSMPANVTVSFDRQGDGVVEARRGMSWHDFEGSLFYLLLGSLDQFPDFDDE